MSNAAVELGVPRVQGPQLEFHTEFPVVHIDEAEWALFERFRAVGNLASIASFMTEHDTSDGYPGLGVLDASFKVARNQLRLTPMGASRDVLMGYFDLARLHYAPERPRDEAIRQLLDVSSKDSTFDTTAGLTGIGYVALERATNKASGFGVSRYLGRVAAFSHMPKNLDLMSFAETVVAQPQDFPIARFDSSHSGAHRRYISL